VCVGQHKWQHKRTFIQKKGQHKRTFIHVMLPYTHLYCHTYMKRATQTHIYTGTSYIYGNTGVKGVIEKHTQHTNMMYVWRQMKGNINAHSYADIVYTWQHRRERRHRKIHTVHEHDVCVATDEGQHKHTFIHGLRIYTATQA